jgi:hypothetical protein
VTAQKEVDKGRKFRKLAAAEQSEAIVMLAKALKCGGGAKGAALELGIGEATIHRLANAWPKLRKALEKGLCTPQDIGHMGGTASAESRARRTRKRPRA